jgi:hypothetical protein
MTPVPALISRTSVAVLITTKFIVFDRSTLILRPVEPALTYTSHQREQVEKELETSLSAGKIRIFNFSAGVAQLVEHFLAKEDVASSSLVTRFRPLVPRGLQRGRPPFRQACK